jgi:hypothetical protein
MATKVEDLAAQLEQMQQLLKAHGIQPPAEPVGLKSRPDYIAFGSPEHAAFLGLVEVKEGDKTVTLATYTGPVSGKTYRLEDPIGAIRYFPGIEPEKAALLVLQQKVNSLESPVEPPKDAPAPFQPAAVYPT